MRSISKKLRFLDFDLQTLEAGVKTMWGIITHEPSINADDYSFWSFLLLEAVVYGKLVLTSFWRLGQFVESRPTNVMGGDDVLQTAQWWIQAMRTLSSLVAVQSIHLVLIYYGWSSTGTIMIMLILPNPNEQSAREGWGVFSTELKWVELNSQKCSKEIEVVQDRTSGNV